MIFATIRINSRYGGWTGGLMIWMIWNHIRFYIHPPEVHGLSRTRAIEGHYYRWTFDHLTSIYVLPIKRAVWLFRNWTRSSSGWLGSIRIKHLSTLPEQMQARSVRLGDLLHVYFIEWWFLASRSTLPLTQLQDICSAPRDTSWVAQRRTVCRNMCS